MLPNTDKKSEANWRDPEGIKTTERVGKNNGGKNENRGKIWKIRSTGWETHWKVSNPIAKS
jgi:hypothetical protein